MEDETDVRPFEYENTGLHFGEWIKNVLTAAVCIGLVALTWGIVSINNTQGEIQVAQAAGRGRGFKILSLSCEGLIIDNDRTFVLSEDCTAEDVLKYYPPEICVFLGSPDGCGSDFTPSTYIDPPRAGQ